MIKVSALDGLCDLFLDEYERVARFLGSASRSGRRSYVLGSVLNCGLKLETRTPGGQHGPPRASRPPEPLVIRVKRRRRPRRLPSLRRDVLSARAGIAEVRWALLGAAPRRALRGALQGLLEEGGRPASVPGAPRETEARPQAHRALRRVGAIGRRRPRTIDRRRLGSRGGRDPSRSTGPRSGSRGRRRRPRRALTAACSPAARVETCRSGLSPGSPVPQLIRLSNPGTWRRCSPASSRRLPPPGTASGRSGTVPANATSFANEPAPVAPTRAVFAKLSRRDDQRGPGVRVAQVSRTGSMRARRNASAAALAAVAEDGVILFPEVSGPPLSELLCRHDG